MITSHQLAKQLLEMPDLPIGLPAITGYDDSKDILDTPLIRIVDGEDARTDEACRVIVIDRPAGSANASNTFGAEHRRCPACRGYELERRWCSICNGHGTIRKTPNDQRDGRAESGTSQKPKNRLALAIGENIKRFRLKAGMTQAQLAAAIGYKEAKGSAGASICRAEVGTQQPRIETLNAIAKALGVKVCELLHTGPEQ